MDHTENDTSRSSSIVSCIHCHGNMFTKTLPGNDRGIHIQTHRLMGGTYEVCHWDRFRCHDIHTKCHKNWFRHSKVDGGGKHVQTHTQKGDIISLLIFCQNKESRSKMVKRKLAIFRVRMYDLAF
jgi:hypothetical protein